MWGPRGATGGAIRVLRRLRPRQPRPVLRHLHFTASNTKSTLLASPFMNSWLHVLAAAFVPCVNCSSMIDGY